MNARTSHPVLGRWLNGYEVERDELEIAIADALREIDGLNARVTTSEADADRLADLLHDVMWVAETRAAEALEQHANAISGRTG